MSAIETQVAEKRSVIAVLQELFARFKGFDVNQRLVLLTLVSTFLSFLTAVPFVFGVAVYALVKKPVRDAILSDKTLWLLPLLICFIGAANSLIIGNYIGAAATVGIMLPTFILFAFAQQCMTEKLYSVIMNAIMAISIPCTVLAIFQALLGSDGPRIASSFFNPNLYAYALCLIILVFIYNYCRVESLRSKTVVVVGGGLNFLAMLLTGCRTAMLALAVGALMLFIFMKKYRSAAVLIIASCIVGVALFTVPGLFRSSSLYEDFLNRISIIKESWDGFLMRPVLGNGILGFKFLGLTGRNTIHAHNIIFNLLLDCGIVGTLFFTGYIGNMVKKIFIKMKQKSPLSVLLFSILVATLIHSMMDVPLMGGQNATLLVILLSGINLVGKGDNNLLME